MHLQSVSVPRADMKS